MKLIIMPLAILAFLFGVIIAIVVWGGRMKKNWECPACKRYFTSQRGAAQHIRDVHPGGDIVAKRTVEKFRKHTNQHKS